MKAHDDVNDSDAYRRGVAQALADRATAPADDGTVEVSIPGLGGNRHYFHLCRTCGHPRDLGGCRCPTPRAAP